MIQLNVLRAFNNEKIGTIEMREKRFDRLAAFNDHENKPMNLILRDAEIAELHRQNPFDKNEPSQGPAFSEDEEITLEIN